MTLPDDADDILEILRQRLLLEGPPKPHISHTRIKELVRGVVTNHVKDEMYSTHCLHQLYKMIGKQRADELVLKGMANRRNKKRII